MIEISKSEKERIVKELPDVKIVRTVKRKSNRHRYYCEEDKKAMRLLRQIRGGADEERVGAKHGNRKEKR